MGRGVGGASNPSVNTIACCSLRFEFVFKALVAEIASEKSTRAKDCRLRSLHKASERCNQKGRIQTGTGNVTMND